MHPATFPTRNSSERLLRSQFHEIMHLTVLCMMFLLSIDFPDLSLEIYFYDRLYVNRTVYMLFVFSFLLLFFPSLFPFFFAVVVVVFIAIVKVILHSKAWLWGSWKSRSSIFTDEHVPLGNIMEILRFLFYLISFVI